MIEGEWGSRTRELFARHIKLLYAAGLETGYYNTNIANIHPLWELTPSHP